MCFKSGGARTGTAIPYTTRISIGKMRRSCFGYKRLGALESRVDLQPLVDISVDCCVALIEHHRAIAELANGFRAMRSKHQCSIVPFLEQLVMAFLMKIGVADHNDFID